MEYSLAYHYTCSMAQSHSLIHEESMAKQNSTCNCHSITMLFYL